MFFNNHIENLSQCNFMGVAAAVIGGAVIGGVASNMAAGTQADAAQSAADTSASAAKYSADLQKQMYDQTRTDQMPWRTVGGNALNQLAYGVGVPAQNGYGPAMTDAELTAQYDKLYPPTTAAPATTTKTQNALGSQNTYTDENGFVRQRTLGLGSQNNPSGFMPLSLQGMTSKISNPAQTTSTTPTTNDTQRQADLAKYIADYRTQNAPGSFQGTGEQGSLSKPFSMEDYQADPGYAFRLSEGIKGLDRSAAAKGQLLSGSQLKGVTDYSQNAASNEYQNAYNRYVSNQNQQYNQLAGLAGVGQTANNSLQQAGQNYATNTGNLTMTNAANQGNALLTGANMQNQNNASMYGTLGSFLGTKTGGNLLSSAGSFISGLF